MIYTTYVPSWWPSLYLAFGGSMLLLICSRPKYILFNINNSFLSFILIQWNLGILNVVNSNSPLIQTFWFVPKIYFKNSRYKKKNTDDWIFCLIWNFHRQIGFKNLKISTVIGRKNTYLNATILPFWNNNKIKKINLIGILL